MMKELMQTTLCIAGSITAISGMAALDSDFITLGEFIALEGAGLLSIAAAIAFEETPKQEEPIKPVKRAYNWYHNHPEWLDTYK